MLLPKILKSQKHSFRGTLGGSNILALVFTVVAAMPFKAHAEESEALLGNWGGARDSLAENGIEVEAVLTLDSIHNVSGGLKRDSGTLFNADLTASIDTEKAGLWKGGTFFFYFLGDAGSDPTEFVGDVQATDNIESYDTFKLYEAWLDQEIGVLGGSILFGLHDYNSEFNALEYAGTLINSSFGIEPDISQVGPSIFPTTALGLRLKLEPCSGVYLLTAAYDGVPGDPNDPRGTHIRLGGDDGVFGAAETGIVAGEDEDYYKLGVGGWLSNAHFEDFSGNARSDNGGLYVIGERLLYAEEDRAQGLGAFFQAGWTHPDRNQISNYVGGGLSYTGLVPNREADVLSIGYAYARMSGDYRAVTEGTTSAESVLEITYSVEVTPYLSVQPDIQFVHNPGGVSDVDDAVVLGVRSGIAL